MSFTRYLELTKCFWEVAVDRVILPNRQNNALNLKVSSWIGNRKLKDVEFTQGVYDNSYEAFDEFVNLTSNTTLKLNLMDDEFYIGDC